MAAHPGRTTPHLVPSDCEMVSRACLNAPGPLACPPAFTSAAPGPILGYSSGVTKHETTLRTPRSAKVILYGSMVLTLAFILLQVLPNLIPGKVGIFIARNSEAFLAVLILCAWIDLIKGRLRGRSSGLWASALAGLVLVVLGLVLREMPWPSRFVTLNEALIGCGILLPYVQQFRPSRSTFLLPGLAIGVAAVAGTAPFVTDMAEALGLLVVVPLVLGWLDPGALRGGPVNTVRNLCAAGAILASVAVLRLFTPESDPTGVVENLLFFIQRANEGMLTGIVLLVYYATRSAAGK